MLLWCCAFDLSLDPLAKTIGGNPSCTPSWGKTSYKVTSEYSVNIVATTSYMKNYSLKIKIKTKSIWLHYSSFPPRWPIDSSEACCLTNTHKALCITSPVKANYIHLMMFYDHRDDVDDDVESFVTCMPSLMILNALLLPAKLFSVFDNVDIIAYTRPRLHTVLQP